MARPMRMLRRLSTRNLSGDAHAELSSAEETHLQTATFELRIVPVDVNIGLAIVELPTRCSVTAVNIRDG